MDLPSRLDPLDLEVAPDEELPDYEPSTAPEYHSADYEIPLVIYQLRQIDRKQQAWVPFGPSAPWSSFRFISHHFRLLSKKPNLEMFHASLGQINGDSIASIRYDNNGPLPWRPRAHFDFKGSQGKSTHAMESRNFADWTAMIQGLTYVWSLEGKPVSLVLSEKGSTVVIARFTYSARGTTAMHGAEVGDLTVYRDGLSIEADGIQKIMCSLMVAITHFKRMGRHYWNDAPIRSASLTRAHLPSHSVSFASYSNA